MGVHEDVMESRAAAALTLRQFDEDSRRLGVRRLPQRLATERNSLTRMLSDLGGCPWPYCPDGDNSWVP